MRERQIERETETERERETERKRERQMERKEGNPIGEGTSQSNAEYPYCVPAYIKAQASNIPNRYSTRLVHN